MSKRKEQIVTAVILLSLPLLYFYPAVKGQIVLMMGDGWAYSVLMKMLLGQMIAHGQLPLWNPHIFAGMPFLAALQVGAFYPINWIFAFLPPGVAMNVVVISSYQIALSGAYLYGQAIRMSRAGALVAAVSFTFGGFLVMQFDQTNFIAALVWMPWVLLAIEKLSQAGRWRWVVAGAVFIALQTFAGLPQASFLTALVAGSYTLFRFVIRDRGIGRWRFVGLVTFLVTCGGLLSAIQLLPARELQLQGDRAQISYEFFAHWSMPPRRALALLFPNFFGGGLRPLYQHPGWDAVWLVRWAHGYAGMAALLLALVAVISVFKNKRGKDESRAGEPATMLPAAAHPPSPNLVCFWACVAGASLFLALGAYLRFDLNYLLYRLPVYNLFRGSFRHLFNYSFAVAVLAGFGMTSLLQVTRQRAMRLLAVSAMLLGGVLVAALVVYLFFPTTSAVENSAAVVSTSWRDREVLVPLFSFALSVAAVWAATRWRNQVTAAAMIVTLWLDLAAFGYFTEWRTVRWDALASFADPAAVTFLKAREANLRSFRVLDYPIGDYPLDCAALNCQNMSLARGLQSGGGYEPMRLARVAEVAGAMNILGKVTDPSALELADQGLNLLNVKYLLKERSASSNDDAAFTIQHDGTPFKASLAGITLAPGGRFEASGESLAADRLGIVSALANSGNLADGAVVARIKLYLKNGATVERELLAGRDSAEWAWERADVRASIKHKRAPVAENWDAEGFSGHRYLATFALERAEIESVAIEYAAPEGQLIIERISLYDSVTGRVTAPDTRKLPRGRWNHLATFGAVEVYENLRALPRAWFVSRVVRLPEADILRTIKAGKFADGQPCDLREIALLVNETAGRAPSQTDALIAPGRASVQITRYEPSRIELQTSNEPGRMLVLSEIDYPGWRAFVDGAEVPVERTDAVLRGVFLPAGDHKVVFQFAPASFRQGVWCALLAGVMLAVGAVLRRR